MVAIRKFFYANSLSINPNYVRPSLLGGSVLLWVFLVQVLTGFCLAFLYCSVFDTGVVGVIHFWWETRFGAFMARLHSEFGNIFFFMLYAHILIKFWNNAFFGEGNPTWITGSVILVLSYVVGITGAIMPCSVLSEVTATVIGYAINSMVFVSFDFLGDFMIPGLGLNDDTMFRVFLIHAIVPLIIFVVVIEHTSSLHCTDYIDEEELELLFSTRYDYLYDFIWAELYAWLELIFFFLLARTVVDFFSRDFMTVSYSYANFEFWPLQEDIDFVLAIPHWYLRPLMGSLVLIPHHYIGFFVIMSYFICIIILPWFSKHFRLSNHQYVDRMLSSKFPLPFDNIGTFFWILFLIALIYGSLVVPTGRYFVSLGSNELLAYAYWYIIYFLVSFRITKSFYQCMFYFCITYRK